VTQPVLRYREIAGLPRLAWLASTPRDAGEVLVYHGSAVECTPEWMVEGVWDGEFRLGAFHRSPHFFGSGIRVEQGQVHFVPSSALVNRLLYCIHQDRILVSNSLALLLAFTGAKLDPAHDYRAETYAIRQGAGRYPRAFLVTHPEIQTFYQLYDESLVLAGGERSFQSPRPRLQVPSFEQYRTLVTEALQLLRANYASPERRFPMTAFATISSGYDSAASAALVANLGIATCFTSRRSNSHIPWWLSRRAGTDDGTPIADLLRLRTAYLDPRHSRVTEDELYYLAPGCAPTMTVLHSLTRDLERRGGAAVLFTGFQGDEVWDVNPWERAYQDAGVLRGDTTALMLTEIRLQCGIVNVAVPSLLARSVQDIAAIAASPEMTPWRLGNGYDRPIARRILESAGVPRALFGSRKKAVVERRSYPVNPALRAGFFAYLGTHYGCSAGFVYLHDAVNQFVYPFVRVWHLMRKALFGIEPPPTPRAYVWKRFDFASVMFVWAAGTLSARLAVVLRESGATRHASRARRRSDPQAAQETPWSGASP